MAQKTDLQLVSLMLANVAGAIATGANQYGAAIKLGILVQQMATEGRSQMKPEEWGALDGDDDIAKAELQAWIDQHAPKPPTEAPQALALSATAEGNTITPAAPTSAADSAGGGDSGGGGAVPE